MKESKNVKDGPSADNIAKDISDKVEVKDYKVGDITYDGKTGRAINPETGEFLSPTAIEQGIAAAEATGIPSGVAAQGGVTTQEAIDAGVDAREQLLDQRIQEGIESTGMGDQGTAITEKIITEQINKETLEKKFDVPKNIGESFSEFRGRGNTRGFYNIPSSVTVNTNEFVVSEERGYQLLSKIDTYSGNNARLKNFRDEKNELIYQKVYGGTGVTIDYNGKIFNPGDDGYNNAFVEIRKIINESNI